MTQNNLTSRDERRGLKKERDPERRMNLIDRRAEHNDQFVSFYIGSHYFGFPINQVQEISLPLDATNVPGSCDHCKGLINLRGQIIPSMDLRIRLNLEQRKRDCEPVCLIVQGSDGLLGINVHKLGDVLKVGKSHFEKVPPTLPANLASFVKGVYKLSDNLLVILDLERLTKGVEPKSHL